MGQNEPREPNTVNEPADEREPNTVDLANAEAEGGDREPNTFREPNTEN